MSALLLGIDGYDSPNAGCTTHFTVFLLKHLFSNLRDLSLREPPHLVRLNPNAPWRTRGNASIALHLDLPSGENTIKKLLDTAKEAASKYSWAVGENKGTIIIMEDSDENGRELAVWMYRKAVKDILPRQIAKKLLHQSGAHLYSIGDKSIVGSLAAIGFTLSKKRWTYELLAYRKIGSLGKRRVDDESVRKAEERFPTLFNNYDYIKRKNIASPSGPDPVLIGLRGIHAPDLLKAMNYIKIDETISNYCVFLTNQHTDAHDASRTVRSFRLYQTGSIEGVVTEKPRILNGGHVSIRVSDDTGTLRIIFYRETRPLNLIASKLERGDYIRVLGSLTSDAEGFVLNGEKIWARETAPHARWLKPICPKCGSRMKSAGKNKGYKCPKCGYRLREDDAVKEIRIEKRVFSKTAYTPYNGRLRHLISPPILNNIRETSVLPPRHQWCASTPHFN